jgi:hypothetical protein
MTQHEPVARIEALYRRMARKCQEKTLGGTKGRTLGQSVKSLSGVKPPGSRRVPTSADDASPTFLGAVQFDQPRWQENCPCALIAWQKPNGSKWADGEDTRLLFSRVLRESVVIGGQM